MVTPTHAEEPRFAENEVSLYDPAALACDRALRAALKDLARPIPRGVLQAQEWAGGAGAHLARLAWCARRAPRSAPALAGVRSLAEVAVVLGLAVGGPSARTSANERASRSKDLAAPIRYENIVKEPAVGRVEIEAPTCRRAVERSVFALDVGAVGKESEEGPLDGGTASHALGERREVLAVGHTVPEVVAQTLRQRATELVVLVDGSRRGAGSRCVADGHASIRWHTMMVIETARSQCQQTDPMRYPPSCPSHRLECERRSDRVDASHVIRY